MTSLEMRRLAQSDRRGFITRLQEAFQVGAAAYEHGQSQSSIRGEQDEPVISEGEVSQSMDHAGADTWEVLDGGRVVGGAVVVVDGQGDRASLDLLFIDVGEHGRGIGVRVWNAIEAKYPDVEVWRTMTPYEDVRNIHFYVNKCGFRVVEFFHPGHPDPHQPSGPEEGVNSAPERMFAFEKRRLTAANDL